MIDYIVLFTNDKLHLSFNTKRLKK